VSLEAVRPAVSSRLAQRFVEAAIQEVGEERLAAILAKGDLPPSAIQKNALSRLGGAEAAELYAALQRTLRLFYGRGARGTLIRIGRGMWARLVQQANFREKAELEIVRRLPVPARRRRIMDLVAGYLREAGGPVSVQSLDLDLLLVDHGSASAHGQVAEDPLCAVTLGLIRGALFWGIRQDADVEETACRAAGALACEFRVKPGGK
jgi:predicted hydrocarbon binding protein